MAQPGYPEHFRRVAEDLSSGPASLLIPVRLWGQIAILEPRRPLQSHGSESGKSYVV